MYLCYTLHSTGYTRSHITLAAAVEQHTNAIIISQNARARVCRARGCGLAVR